MIGDGPGGLSAAIELSEKRDRRERSHCDCEMRLHDGPFNEMLHCRRMVTVSVVIKPNLACSRFLGSRCEGDRKVD